LEIVKELEKRGKGGGRGGEKKTVVRCPRLGEGEGGRGGSRNHDRIITDEGDVQRGGTSYTRLEKKKTG